MGHTKEVRRGDIRALANNYKVPVKLSQGEIDQCADLGKYDVFPAYFPEYSHLFRVTASTFNHAAAWPTNFFALAGRQWISDGLGGEIPVRYIDVSELHTFIRNARIAGTATQPVLYLYDQKFGFYPTSVTGMHIETFAFPAPLADPSVADSATDTMPEISEPDIARAGFEFMLKMLVDQQTAYQLNKQEMEQIESAIKSLYEEKFEALNKGAEAV